MSSSVAENLKKLQEKHNTSENVPVVTNTSNASLDASLDTSLDTSLKNNQENKTNSNILTQINLYNNEKIESNILDLEDIYQSELDRYNNLKNKDPDKCIEECNDFLKKNNDIIETQLDKIISLEKNIKEVILKCEEIEKSEEKLKSLIQKDEFVETAGKIKKMRSTIDNLNSFLVRKKISNYKS